MLLVTAFFDFREVRWASIFAGVEYPWDAIGRIREFILERVAEDRVIGEGTSIPTSAFLEGAPISFGRNCLVEPGAYIRGPFLAGDNVIVRQGAYLRGDVLLGDGCVVGHATEVKNSILLGGTKAPHFNYVGDSILGSRVNLGAGTKISNLRVAPGTVKVRAEQAVFDTHLRKLGAVIGDDAETGCNVVLNPGTLVGPRALIYPCCSVRGAVPPDAIVKLRQELEVAAREPSPLVVPREG